MVWRKRPALQIGLLARCLDHAAALSIACVRSTIAALAHLDVISPGCRNGKRCTVGVSRSLPEPATASADVCWTSVMDVRKIWSELHEGGSRRLRRRTKETGAARWASYGRFMRLGFSISRKDEGRRLGERLGGKEGSSLPSPALQMAVLGSIVGTDYYTDDSSIWYSRRHSGLITKASGGTVRIELKAGASSYWDYQKWSFEQQLRFRAAHSYSSANCIEVFIYWGG